MKLLIVNNNMAVGGIQKSLANLLTETAKYHDVTLMLFNPSGALLSDIPENVRILKGNAFTKIMGMSQAEARADSILTALWRSLWVIASRVFGSGFSYTMLSKMQRIKENYDVSVSYMQNSEQKTFYGGCNEFVLYSTKAPKKISFVHCDMKNYIGNNPYNIALYKKFSAVACVSDSCKRVFDEVVPGLKTYSVHNMYDFEKIAKLSDEYPVILSKDCVNLFTSARISEEKGILRMLPIFERIKAEGGSFKWYIAGDGPLYNAAVSEADRCGLGENVIFLGQLKNPYPYFKNADIVLVPSYNEAAPMVYGEALCFGTPVFTTDTTSAEEIIGEENGWVVKNSDVDIYNQLKTIIMGDAPIKQINCELTNEKAKAEFEEMLK